MIFIEHFNLKNSNTFGIEAHCATYAEVSSVKQLKNVLKNNKKPIVILGGGSNMLFTQPFYDCIFIKNKIKKRKIHGEIVEIGGGENWHQFVLWALKNNLGGVENLSLIPGTVGAAPIQNIGAYGVELKDIFVKLEALNLQTLEIQTFTKEDCQFGYRESIFKKALKGQFFITKVFLKLNPNPSQVNTQYGDIQKTLLEMKVTSPTIQDISKSVIKIRQSKLPDPSVIGNAGSFFKNPEIPKAQFDALKTTFPNIVGYPTEGGIKVAAGWLIEQCGWKGKKMGDVGVHEKQALVLVNYGNGKGIEIKELSQKIQESILQKFNIKLTPEVNIF